MKAQDIYDLLRAGGLTRAGALGMIGNLAAESGLKENIAQRGMTKLTDEQYTSAADNGFIDFVRDGIGYGLAQFTYWSRKQGLLNKAKAYAASVGDGTLQVEYILDELVKDFPTVYAQLIVSNDVDACADLICKEYERPAVNNFLMRRELAHKYEAEIQDMKPSAPKDPYSATFPPDPTILAFQLFMNYNGYETATDGYKSAEFFKTLRKFVDDMEGC